MSERVDKGGRIRSTSEAAVRKGTEAPYRPVGPAGRSNAKFDRRSKGVNNAAVQEASRLVFVFFGSYSQA